MERIGVPTLPLCESTLTYCWCNGVKAGAFFYNRPGGHQPFGAAAFFGFNELRKAWKHQ
jgi:hypothetical protein